MVHIFFNDTSSLLRGES